MSRKGVCVCVCVCVCVEGNGTLTRRDEHSSQMADGAPRSGRGVAGLPGRVLSSAETT